MPPDERSPNPYQSPAVASRDEKPSAMAQPPFAVIGRCARLGAKVAFLGLTSVVLVMYLLIAILILYRSFEDQVSPLTFIEANGSPVQTLAAPLLSIVAGTAFGALIGSVIGAVAAAIRYLSSLVRRSARHDTRTTA